MPKVPDANQPKLKPRRKGYRNDGKAPQSKKEIQKKLNKVKTAKERQALKNKGKAEHQSKFSRKRTKSGHIAEEAEATSTPGSSTDEEEWEDTASHSTETEEDNQEHGSEDAVSRLLLQSSQQSIALSPTNPPQESLFV
jgi:hypothetical protein